MIVALSLSKMNIDPELHWDKDQTMKNHTINSPDAHARYQVESYMAAAAVWRAEIQTKLYYEVQSVIIGTTKEALQKSTWQRKTYKHKKPSLGFDNWSD